MIQNYVSTDIERNIVQVRNGFHLAMQVLGGQLAISHGLHQSQPMGNLCNRSRPQQFERDGAAQPLKLLAKCADETTPARAIGLQVARGSG